MPTFQPVPTYADPVEVDKKTGKSAFNPTWLSWFLTLSNGGLTGTLQHNNLAGLQGGIAGQFYHLTQAQLNAIPFRNTTLPSGITLTGSPFLYRNIDLFDEDVIAKGTTITKLEFSRDNSIFYDLGLLQGMFRLSVGDYFRMTYAGTPTLTKVPR